MSSQLDQIEQLLEEIRNLLDDPDVFLAPVLRRAAKVALLLGDTEHRDLFLLHLQGVLGLRLPGPRHAPWEDPNWKPRWDVREAFMADRLLSADQVMAFPLEELEMHHRLLCEERLRARDRGDTKSELTYYDLEADAKKLLFRI